MNETKMEAKKDVMELHQRRNELTDAIRLISGLITSVQEDVDKVKDDIHSAFNSQMNLLHHREEQLLRQVDVHSTDEINFLHTKCAELHHLTGSVESYLHSMEESPDAEFMNAINKKIASINRMKKRTLNLKFVNDCTGLQSAIQNFGLVSTSCAFPSFSHFEGSTSLPLKIEYEDKEHHLLYKTLDGSGDNKSPTNFNQVKIKFSKPAVNDCEWLVSSPPINATISSSSKFKGALGDNLLKFDETNKNLSSVQNWLREMSSAEEYDLSLKSEMNNRPLSWVDSSSQSSLDDSIVLLSLPRPNSICDCTEVKFLTPLNALTSGWLSKESREYERRHALISGPLSGQRCISNCATDEAFKIVMKSDDSQWLVKEHTLSKNQNRFLMVDVKEACCANEPCKNFYECISDENCALSLGNKKEMVNRELSNENKKALCLIQPMLNIMYEKKASWISPSKLDSEVEDRNILHRNGSSSKKSLGFLNYHLSNDLKNWLGSSSMADVREEKISHKELAEQMDNEKSPLLARKIANMFQSYFTPSDSSVWLSKTTVAEMCVEKESVVL